MIARPKGLKVEKKFLRNGWRENFHRCGFAIATEDEKLLIRKGFTNFKSFYRALREFDGLPAIIHMRWANRGVISHENTHPFYISENLVFAHNGTIPILPSDKEKSDTVTFNEEILQELYKEDKNFLKNRGKRWLIANSIGHSKLVFMNNKGEQTIINKGLGEEFEGVWYSNDDYKKFPVVSKTVVTTIRNGKVISNTTPINSPSKQLAIRS